MGNLADGTGVDLSQFGSQITSALTSATALTAYAAVAGAGVLVGLGVKFAPRLWRFLWRFIPG